MFKSSAKIQYRKEKSGLWITGWMDQSILDYYYSFIPKYYKAVKPKWKAHATIVRPEDSIIKLENWNKHEGDIIEIIYDPYLHVERGIWWINLWSIEMENIRLEFDLSIVSRITKPPWPGYKKCFHCTIANGIDFMDT